MARQALRLVAGVARFVGSESARGREEDLQPTRRDDRDCICVGDTAAHTAHLKLVGLRGRISTGSGQYPLCRHWQQLAAKGKQRRCTISKKACRISCRSQHGLQAGSGVTLDAQRAGSRRPPLRVQEGANGAAVDRIPPHRRVSSNNCVVSASARHASAATRDGTAWSTAVRHPPVLPKYLVKELNQDPTLIQKVESLCCLVARSA